MSRLAVIVVALAAGAVLATPAGAAVRKRHPVVVRSAQGTVIQPTRTIIRHADGSTTVIVVPRRSYLDLGTNVSVGDRHYLDYAFPVGGDPGRPNWYYGPDVRGAGSYPFPGGGNPFYLPGLNPDLP